MFGLEQSIRVAFSPKPYTLVSVSKFVVYLGVYGITHAELYGEITNKPLIPIFGWGTFKIPKELYTRLLKMQYKNTTNELLEHYKATTKTLNRPLKTEF